MIFHPPPFQMHNTRAFPCMISTTRALCFKLVSILLVGELRGLCSLKFKLFFVEIYMFLVIPYSLLSRCTTQEFFRAWSLLSEHFASSSCHYCSLVSWEACVLWSSSWFLLKFTYSMTFHTPPSPVTQHESVSLQDLYYQSTLLQLVSLLLVDELRVLCSLKFKLFFVEICMFHDIPYSSLPSCTTRECFLAWIPFDSKEFPWSWQNFVTPSRNYSPS